MPGLGRAALSLLEKRQKDKMKIPAYFTLTAFFVFSGIQAAELKDSLEVVAQTNRNAAESQQKIDQLSRENQGLLEEYRRMQNRADYQAAYTLELQQLSIAQEARIETLNRQIEEAGLTQQRIVPLMRSMANALEKFVALDLPFHQQERLAAVLLLKQRLRQPGLPLPAKFRLLLETWQLEQDYGLTIEAWRGPLTVADGSLSLEFLRIGRVALYYQSMDGQESAYWNTSSQSWEQLADEFNQPLSEAIRVAKKQVAPRLLLLPMVSPEPVPCSGLALYSCSR